MLGTIGTLMMREAIEAIRPIEGKSNAPRKRRHHPIAAALPMRWRVYGSGLYISPLAPAILGFLVGYITKIGTASGGEQCVSECRDRWDRLLIKKKQENNK